MEEWERDEWEDVGRLLIQKNSNKLKKNKESKCQDSFSSTLSYDRYLLCQVNPFFILSNPAQFI